MLIVRNLKYSIFICLLLNLSNLGFAQSLEWGLTFGASSQNTLCIDSAGNPLSGGSFFNTVDFDPGIGTNYLTSSNWGDGYIAKFGNNGNLWGVDTYSGIYDQRINVLLNGLNNDLFISGTSSGSQNFIEKRSSSGNLIWSRFYTVNTGSTNPHVIVNDMTLDSSGNLYTIGHFYLTATFSSSPQAVFTSIDFTMFVTKHDSTGNFLWVKTFGGNSLYDRCRGNAIKISSIGEIYCFGNISGSVDFDPDSISNYILTGNQDNFILKLTSQGSLIWIKKYNNERNSGNMTLDSQDNILVSGVAYNTTVDFDLDSGIYTIPGFLNGFFITKLDSSGNMLWASSINTDYSTANEILTDQAGNIYSCGGFNNVDSVDMDPGPGVHLVHDQGNDGYVLKLNQSGNFMWAGIFGGFGSSVCNDLAMDASGNLTLIGIFSQELDLNPFNDTLMTVLGLPQNSFMCKINMCGYYAPPINISSCDTVWYDNIAFTSTGIHYITYTDISGCDSIIVLNIVINPNSFTTIQITGCDTIIFNSLIYTTSGTYTLAFQSAAGCDSIIQLVLVINNSSSSSFSINACDSLAFNNQVFYTSGNYQVVLASSSGCDSIILLTLSIININTTVVVSGITLSSQQPTGTYQWVDCMNGFTSIPGAINPIFTPTVNGLYALIIISQNGCTDTTACIPVTSVGNDEFINSIKSELVPNPVNDLLYINFHLYLKNIEITFSDLTSKVIRKENYYHINEIIINLSDLSEGIYLVKIEGENFIETKRIVVIR